MTKKVDFGMQGDSLEIEDGGVVQVKSGGRVHVASGASVDIATGGDIKANGVSLIDEVAALTGLDSGEVQVLNAVTPGTAAANKAVVLGASKEIATITTATITNINVANLATTSEPTTTAGVGSKIPATVTVAEKGDGTLHKTILTLTTTPITLTDEAGVGQYGSINLYDMLAGNHHFLGAVIDADITLTETWWTDAAEGDVGLGTTAVTNGDALATTEQNIVATTAIAAMTAQVGPINAGSGAAATIAAAGTIDSKLYLNVRIDDSAAHMPDAVTNGAMAADTDWTKGTGWTIAAGVADSDGSQVADSDLSQDISAVEGVSYSVTYTVTRSAGTITPYLGGTAGTARSTANTFVETIVAGADGILLFRADLDFVGTLDDVIATPLTGSGTITGTVKVAWMNLGDY